jgi:putative transcriptional regulator
MAVGKKVLAALQEILEYEEGRRTKVRVSSVTIDDEIDVRAIRETLRLSQREFSRLYGIPVATVQNWESGRREPELSARLLLRVIQDNPDVVARAIRVSGP